MLELSLSKSFCDMFDSSIVHRHLKSYSCWLNKMKIVSIENLIIFVMVPFTCRWYYASHNERCCKELDPVYLLLTGFPCCPLRNTSVDGKYVQ